MIKQVTGCHDCPFKETDIIEDICRLTAEVVGTEITTKKFGDQCPLLENEVIVKIKTK